MITSYHLNDLDITIGFMTKQNLRKLLDEGSISQHLYKKIYQAVKAFFLDATDQALKKLPFDDIMQKI